MPTLRPTTPYPFKIGTRIRFIGTPRLYWFKLQNGHFNREPWLMPGMEFVVENVFEGKPGEFSIGDATREDGFIPEIEGFSVVRGISDVSRIPPGHDLEFTKIIPNQEAFEWEVIRIS